MEINTTRSKPMYTLGEELFNAISHGLGTVLGMVGLVLMLFISVPTGSVKGIISCTVYGLSLIILYTMSTLYHALTHPTAKKVFRIFDHCTIYLLIAGTYTPVFPSDNRRRIWLVSVCLSMGTCNLRNCTQCRKHEKI